MEKTESGSAILGILRSSNGGELNPQELHQARSDSHGSFRIVKNLLPSHGGVTRDMGDTGDVAMSPRKSPPFALTPKRATLPPARR